MERVFRSSDFPILPLDLLCPIVMYLKGTILLYESYLRILLVCFVGTARSSSMVRVDGRTVIVLPLPVAWSLALDSFDLLILFIQKIFKELVFRNKGELSVPDRNG
jgi:hypothetical protein